MSHCLASRENEAQVTFVRLVDVRHAHPGEAVIDARRELVPLGYLANDGAERGVVVAVLRTDAQPLAQVGRASAQGYEVWRSFVAGLVHRERAFVHELLPGPAERQLDHGAGTGNP
ncbi:hypothetical protein [Paracidovorax avenae]|uniref:hypothetical protein n=1 Tax=Paracidovorax avenae TaxID=80867 RepID=UPI001E47C840|nr:hypothetical protein [Paracidovorax avenae]